MSLGSASYLGSRALISSIFQQIFYDIDVVFLGSHVQRREAILRTNDKQDAVSRPRRASQGRRQERERANTTEGPSQPHLRLRVDVGSLLHEDFDNFCLSGQRGDVKGRVSFLFGRNETENVTSVQTP